MHATVTDENAGVLNVWVKYQPTNQRMREFHGLKTVAEARCEFGRLTRDPEVRFAQFGALTVNGSIVLGEYRP